MKYSNDPVFFIHLDKDSNTYKILEISGILFTDASHRNLKENGFDVKGCFGRKDYAEIWCDFYNGKYNRNMLHKKLDKCVTNP